jgi:hypothetical protein
MDHFDDDLAIGRIGQHLVHAQHTRRAQLKHAALAFVDDLPGDRGLVAQLRFPLCAVLVQMMCAVDVRLAVGRRILLRNVRLSPKALVSLV